MADSPTTSQGAAISPELLEKMLNAADADELASVAADAGVKLSGKEAAALFSSKQGEIVDDELSDVTGGCGGGSDVAGEERCPACGSTNCTFSNEKTFLSGPYDRRTYDGHCNSCGHNFTYIKIVN